MFVCEHWVGYVLMYTCRLTVLVVCFLCIGIHGKHFDCLYKLVRKEDLTEGIQPFLRLAYSKVQPISISRCYHM